MIRSILSSYLIPKHIKSQAKTYYRPLRWTPIPPWKKDITTKTTNITAG